jgi:hypothetical protein
MELRCRRHPDREAAGTCCYCERPLCAECLSTNPKGRSFCKNEEECLAYQDGLSSPGGEEATPVADYLMNESSLETQAGRLSDVLGELEELRCLLESAEGRLQSGGGDGQPALPPFEADPRIPGLCAGKLLEEAVALLGLLEFRIAIIGKEQEGSGGSEPTTTVNRVREFIEQKARPGLRDHTAWAGRYGSADPSDVLDSIALPFTRTSRIS